MKLKALFQRRLLIYQMPKVGSQTVEATLRRCSLPHEILRFHYLSPGMAKTYQQILADAEKGGSHQQAILAQLQLLRNVRRMLALQKVLGGCGIKLPKIDVITGVREPIGQALSASFENYERSFPDLEPAAIESHFRQAMQQPEALSRVQNWFDREMKPAVGLDVYATPFPQNKGYAIYENRLARVLVYRFESLAALPEMLREFLGCTVSEVVSCNVGTTKAYGKRYQHVRENLRLPAAFVAAHCHSKMMRHFYSPEERQRFCNRWAEPASGPCGLT